MIFVGKKKKEEEMVVEKMKMVERRKNTPRIIAKSSLPRAQHS